MLKSLNKFSCLLLAACLAISWGCAKSDRILAEKNWWKMLTGGAIASRGGVPTRGLVVKQDTAPLATKGKSGAEHPVFTQTLTTTRTKFPPLEGGDVRRFSISEPENAGSAFPPIQAGEAVDAPVFQSWQNLPALPAASKTLALSEGVPGSPGSTNFSPPFGMGSREASRGIDTNTLNDAQTPASFVPLAKAGAGNLPNSGIFTPPSNGPLSTDPVPLLGNTPNGTLNTGPQAIVAGESTFPGIAPNPASPALPIDPPPQNPLNPPSNPPSPAPPPPPPPPSQENGDTGNSQSLIFRSSALAVLNSEQPEQIDTVASLEDPATNDSSGNPPSPNCFEAAPGVQVCSEGQAGTVIASSTLVNVSDPSARLTTARWFTDGMHCFPDQADNPASPIFPGPSYPKVRIYQGESSSGPWVEKESETANGCGQVKGGIYFPPKACAGYMRLTAHFSVSSDSGRKHYRAEKVIGCQNFGIAEGEAFPEGNPIVYLDPKEYTPHFELLAPLIGNPSLIIVPSQP